MKALHVNIILALIFIFGCQVSSDENLEWEVIKDKQDFASFFNFALNNTDSVLHSMCIDSLEKYKPKNESIVLNRYEYYNHAKDTLVETGFYEYDECDIRYESKMRNIVYVNIDRNDSVQTNYIYNEYKNYSELITTLIDTTGSSLEIPETKVIEWNNKHYLSRNLAVYIHCEIFPDTLVKKTTWSALIQETKGVLATFNSLRNSRSKHIFQKEYSEVIPEKKKLIIGLVPMFMKIRFFGSFINIQPPPPPVHPGVLEILNDTIEGDLE